MFKDTRAYSGFSVDDLGKAKEFYGKTLGLEVSEDQEMGMLTLKIAGGANIVSIPRTTTSRRPTPSSTSR